MAEKEKETKKSKSNKKPEKKGARASSTNPVTRYLRETRGELRKVTWPTREESWRLTAIVIGVSAAMALFLWFWDFIFSQTVHWLIEVLVA